MSDFEMLHIDMDSFFVSVERRDDPELFGKPVIVGGKGDRAVVSSASYEARSFGIRSGMSLVKALKMCPQAVYIYGDFQKYIDSARAIYSLLQKYSPRIEFASIDEAYIDLHGTQRLNGHPIEVAQDIHDRINQKLHLPCSIGLGSNKIMAKIGSNMAKPEGLVAIKKGFESAFLAPLPIDTIPFLGKKTKAKLNSFGITQILR